MARAGKINKRILAKMGKTVLGHAWDAPNEVITFILTVDIDSKGINDFIPRKELAELILLEQNMHMDYKSTITF